ncbi:MAG: hypothetical protein ACPGQL_00715 [Thermoplasmatota archaeon]
MHRPLALLGLPLLLLAGLAGCLDDQEAGSIDAGGEAEGPAGERLTDRSERGAQRANTTREPILQESITGPGSAQATIPNGTLYVLLTLRLQTLAVFPEITMTGCPSKSLTVISFSALGEITYTRECRDPDVGGTTIEWTSSSPVMLGTVEAVAHVLDDAAETEPDGSDDDQADDGASSTPR